MVVGALLLAQKGHNFHRRKLTALGLGIISFCLAFLGNFKGELIFTLLICLFLGLGASLVAIPAQTTIQEATPELKRGKVFGLQNNLINISLSLPLALTGVLVGYIGLIQVLWLLAGLTSLATLIEKPWERC